MVGHMRILFLPLISDQIRGQRWSSQPFFFQSPCWFGRRSMGSRFPSTINSTTIYVRLRRVSSIPSSLCSNFSNRCSSSMVFFHQNHHQPSNRGKNPCSYTNFGVAEGLFRNETKKHLRTNTKITIGSENYGIILKNYIELILIITISL